MPLSIAFAPHQTAGPRVRLFLLDATVGVELADIGPQVVDLLLVLDAGEDHLGAWHLGPRILDVVFEFRLVPDDAGILVGVGIGKIGDAAGMPAIDAGELGAVRVLRVVADGMAGQAFVERNLALGYVLRRRRIGRSSKKRRRYNHRPHYQFSLSPMVPVAPHAAQIRAAAVQAAGALCVNGQNSRPAARFALRRCRAVRPAFSGYNDNGETPKWFDAGFDAAV